MRCDTSFINLTKRFFLLFIDKGKKATININELKLVMKLTPTKLRSGQ